MRAYKAEESYKEQSKIKWLLLLLALFINLAILLFLFVLQIEDKLWNLPFCAPEIPVVFEEMPQVQPPSPPPPQFMHDVAALKPGASNFGNPDDIDEFALQAALSDDETKIAQKEAAQEMERQNYKEKTEHEEEFTEPSSKPPSQTTIINEAYNGAPPHPSTKLEKKDIDSKTTTPQQEKNETNKIQERIKAPLKKEITFTDLAKGFLSSLDQGGNDLIERKGNENIRPDFEEMRSLSYMHKIFWYMQNEWSRVIVNIRAAPPPFAVTAVSITLDKDGNLTKSSIIHSCGSNELDDAVLQGIRAASPYPPLPQHFKKENMTFEFGVKHVQNMTQNVPKINFR